MRKSSKIRKYKKRKVKVKILNIFEFNQIIIFKFIKFRIITQNYYFKKYNLSNFV